MDFIPVSPFAIMLMAKEMHIVIVLAAAEMPGNSDLCYHLISGQITKQNFMKLLNICADGFQEKVLVSV